VVYSGGRPVVKVAPELRRGSASRRQERAVARIRPYAVLAAAAAKANVTRLAFPMKLTFCITYWCNYRCQTCNIWKMKPTDELSLDEIRQFFQRSNGFSWVDLTGGEVSLRKDFVDIAAAVIDNCRDLLMLHFPTNGYLTDKLVEYTREIARMGPEKLVVTVSCDGDEETNDRIRGAFAAAQHEIPDLHHRDFHANIVHTGHYLHNDDLELGKQVEAQDLARASEEYARLRGRNAGPNNYLERTYLKKVRRFLETGRTPMRCHALRSSCFIDSWGNVFPCTIYDHKVGNLREVDYELGRIWNAPETAALQREIWDYKCPQCWTPCEAYQSIMGNFLRRG
jgi:MoaA/NifB/PqqE/SkfB family radical SAM enzyme